METLVGWVIAIVFVGFIVYKIGVKKDWWKKFG